MTGATPGRAALDPDALVPALPPTGLVVLVGVAGVGKSTFAAGRFAPADVLSSDALREVVAGDAADQRATKVAFTILHREVRRRLAAGRLVVVDATNVERHARLALVRLARAAAVPAVAIVLVAEPATIHARNAQRAGRIVPAEIVDRHLAALARLGDDPAAVAAAIRLEGFAAVHLVATGPPGPLSDGRS
ncbi:MAG TPA: AAA family ATPase [Candidatus Limnocylindrales bacterium]|nr:AAA family ATPase [Candidatus Limnocylindrales bacterium]